MLASGNSKFNLKLEIRFYDELKLKILCSFVLNFCSIFGNFAGVLMCIKYFYNAYLNVFEQYIVHRYCFIRIYDVT